MEERSRRGKGRSPPRRKGFLAGIAADLAEFAESVGNVVSSAGELLLDNELRRCVYEGNASDYDPASLLLTFLQQFQCTAAYGQPASSCGRVTGSDARFFTPTCPASHACRKGANLIAQEASKTINGAQRGAYSLQ
jgi:hypothetical protein